MTITFQESLPPRTRKGSSHWDEVADELVAHPGSWGTLEEDAPLYRSQLARTNLSKRGPWFEVTFRRGTVYARFAPPPLV